MSGTTAPAAAQGAIASARFPFVDLFTWPAALALLAGATAAQAAPALPARWCDVLLALVGLALMWRRPGVRWLGYALLGAGWTRRRADFARRAPAPRLVRRRAGARALRALAPPRARQASAGAHRSGRLRFRAVRARAGRRGHGLRARRCAQRRSRRCRRLHRRPACAHP